jgi:MFS family permease
LLIRGLAGASSVTLHPGAARTVSLWLPLASRSTANGLVTAGALIGIAVTYPGFGWLMDRLDWPLAFVACGSVMVVFTLIWLAVSTDDVASHPWANAPEKQLVQVSGPPPVGPKPTLDDYLGLLRNRSLVLLTLSYAAISYFQYLFFYWIGYYFNNELKLPESESRQATFEVTIAMAVGMALGGICSDWVCHRFGRRWGCRGIAMAGILLSAVLACLGLWEQDPQRIVMLFSLALGALGLCEGIFWTTAPVLEPRNAGMACAFLNTVGNAGGLLAPICTPWIGVHYGWPAAIGVACLVSGWGALLWLWIDPKGAAD